ncbi:MAG: hypothetical protein LC750_00310 [Actinobacteria bacterium]|nr:hypothetical protein [Actinomycetota bacterium]
MAEPDHDTAWHEMIAGRDAEIVRLREALKGAAVVTNIAKTEVERAQAAIVSIGILNASGAHPDPEIDKVIREYAALSPAGAKG